MGEEYKKELRNGYINLKEYFERLFEEREKRFSLHFELLKQALTKSDIDIERRLEALNQLRSEVVKDRDQFLRRDTYEEKIKGYDVWCTMVNETLTQTKTRYEVRLTLNSVIAILSVIISLITGIAVVMKFF